MIKIVIVFLTIFNLLGCNPVKQASNKESSESTVPFHCLKSQSRCEVMTEPGRISITFSGNETQGKLKTELPFQIQFSLGSIPENYQVTTVVGHLEGKSMYMGKIPVFFEKEKKVWIAQSLLASCAEEVMTWQLHIKFEMLADGKKHQQGFFIDFDSVRL